MLTESFELKDSEEPNFLINKCNNRETWLTSELPDRRSDRTQHDQLIAVFERLADVTSKTHEEKM